MTILDPTRVTLKDLAEKAGVSLATVSRALNALPGVHPDTRERVLAVARELGYPGPGSAALASVNLVGLYLPPHYLEPVPHFYTSGVIQSSFAAAQNSGLLLVLLGDTDLDERLLRLQSGLHGLLIVNIRPHLTPVQHRLLDLGLPTVFLGFVRDPLPEHATAVDVDNYGGAREAVRYLYSLGHRRIAHIAGPHDSLAAQNRLRGFQHAMTDHELPFPDGYVQIGDWHEMAGYEGMRALLALPEPPTAVFCASDAIAMGALKALQTAELPLRVPDDISLIGYDNSPGAVAAGLTTVDHQLPAYGREALALLARLREGERNLPQIVLRPQLVERESCAEPGR